MNNVAGLQKRSGTVGSGILSLSDFEKILYGGQQVELDVAALEKVNTSFNFLQKFSKNKVIYGINTSFGPMAQYKISDADQKQLQVNLIRSHCSGTGNRLPDIAVKAVMLARLNTLMMGYSGIHPEVVELLKELINRDVFPVIFEHGGVGASGDLVQLAHLALVLIGEGEVSYKGKIQDTADVFNELGLKPVSIHLREGLGVMNGTSAMTGIGMINIIMAKNLLEWSLVASAMINEIVESYDDHLSSELNQVKLHRGQNKVAQVMRDIVVDSQLIRRREDYLYNGHIQEEVMKDKVQEYYSLRCVPQILGPVYDTVLNVEKVVVEELNSTNDNPIIDHENNNVFHGGNFHGDYVALEMDKLKIAITKLSMLCERQLNFLLNDKLNNKLLPFVNLGKLGLNFGMQGLQFTCTSTVAENQTLSNPMYIHSIPNNNDNQDIVSMGTNAALITKKIIENSYEVISIELIAILQAIDYLEFESKLSGYSRKIHGDLRKIVPKFISDSPKYKEIQKLKSYILESKLELI